MNETPPLTSNEMALDRTLMALERTLMAWIRTSLSLISFGFTIYKFLQALGDKGGVAIREIRQGGRATSYCPHCQR